MACFSGPEIVNDGLVFAYDMSNSEKSWKGKPTTNLVTDTPTMNGWAGSYTLIDSSTKTFNIQTTQTNATTTSAWRTWYWSVSSYIGQTVTISGDVEFVSETNATFQHITIGQGNTGSFPYHIAGSPAADRVQVATKPIEKISMSWTGVINATGIVGFTQWINNVTVNNGNSILQISNVQIEVNDFKTPFVNGTRSNTQSILDWTGNGSTITMESPSYNQDGTFFFNGGTERIDLTNIGGIGAFNNHFTISAWINSTDISATQNILSMNGPYFMRLNNSRVRFNVLAGSPNTWLFQNGTTVLNSNTWYFLTMVWDGTANTWTGYINDQQEFSISKTGPLHGNTSAKTFLGYVGYTPQIGEQSNFLGQIAVVNYYNKALTATEVKQNFEALRGRFGI